MIGKYARESKEIDGNCPDLPEMATTKKIASTRPYEPLSVVCTVTQNPFDNQ
jgi:hypothetical protein